MSKTRTKFTPEARERAVRMTQKARRDHQWLVQGQSHSWQKHMETIESVELATFKWMAWFNHHRLTEPLGYIPPAEVEMIYHRLGQQAEQTCT